LPQALGSLLAQVDDEPLLSPGDLALLGRLDLAHRLPLAGLYAGERRSPRFARSPEFSDFRPYAPGDDFRQIDWKAYARLERLLLRLYVAEEESALNVVLDTSASMSMGKWRAAIKLCAALCFLGLAAMDRVAVGELSRSQRCTPHMRGRDGMGRLWSFLRALEPRGSLRPQDLATLHWLRPGLVVVVSDFLTAESWDASVAVLRGRRMETVLWQVLAPDEENPALTGDVKLVEVEDQTSRELTITPSLIAEYRANLEEHRRRLARASAGPLVTSTSADTLQDTMLAGLRAGLVVRA
jgi:uncharacterized protein (DUF58 family)